jgi:hypothetical protein
MPVMPAASAAIDTSRRGPPGPHNDSSGLPRTRWSPPATVARPPATSSCPASAWHGPTRRVKQPVRVRWNRARKGGDHVPVACRPRAGNLLHRQLELHHHPGGAPATPPGAQPFCGASSLGSATRTMNWKPRTGDWRRVLMNTNGSSGISADVSIGARVPHPLTIAIAPLGARRPGRWEPRLSRESSQRDGRARRKVRRGDADCVVHPQVNPLRERFMSE